MRSVWGEFYWAAVHFDWHDLAFELHEKRASGGTFIYQTFSVRCAICKKWNWLHWKSYHPQCVAYLDKLCQGDAEGESSSG